MKTILIFLLSTGLLWAQPDFDEHLAISAEEYQQRRDTLREQLGDEPVVIMGNILSVRSNDTDYAFRQDSNFYYLTGFNEPDAYLIISKHPFAYEDKMVKELLFVPVGTPREITYIGKKMGPERAMKELGLELAVPVSSGHPRRGNYQNNFEAYMKTFTQTHRRIVLHTPRIRVRAFGEQRTSYFDKYKQSLLDALLPDQLAEETKPDETNQPKLEILDPRDVKAKIHKMRAIKSPQELKMLERAVDITLSGHRESLKIAKDVDYEYQVEAAIEYAFMYNGAEAQGYNSIVGCGANGTILHYDTNRSAFDQGQIFCLDAGAEYGYYTADITRSFPADGTFSKEQREIYDLVLAAQKAGEKELVPGSNYMRVDAAIKTVIREGLEKLGLIGPFELDPTTLTKGQLFRYTAAEDVMLGDEVLIKKSAKLVENTINKLPEGTKIKVNDGFQLMQFYPHGWGHHVGLDVHDPGGRGEFKTGMVFTIEPGIYISDRIDTPVDPAYMNIGIRIEDMYVVTEDGNRRMSTNLPREIDELEEFMKQKSHLLLRTHKH